MNKVTRIAAVLVVLLCLASSPARALDTRLIDVRDRIFDESKKLQLVLNNSDDPVVIISLWDSCVTTVTRINAYFYMLGIYEMVPQESRTAEGLNYLITWLRETRRTNMLAVNALGAPLETADDTTLFHRKRVQGYFVELNSRLDAELQKLTIVQKSLER